MYIMESPIEGDRLEGKTDSAETRRQLLLTGFKPGIKALDVGSGTGAVARVMADLTGRGGHVTALDVSEQRLQQGRALAEKEGLNNMTFVSGEVMRPPLDPESFDFVWCRFLFEYLPDPLHAMDRLIELTAPGGTLVVGDLDGNAVFHDGLASDLAEQLHQILARLNDSFDPYAGRKLYRLFYEKKMRDIRVHGWPYHLYAGTIPARDLENWRAKFSTIRPLGIEALGSAERYDEFVQRMLEFLESPDTFTYSTLFLVQGIKERK